MQLPATLVNPKTSATIVVDNAQDYVSLVFDCGYRVQADDAGAPTPQPTPPPSTPGGASAPTS